VTRTTFERSAALFPGQGSQAPGMREEVARTCPELLRLATAETGADPFERADESTRFAQPAIFCASVASWSAAPAASREGVGWMAGHSLGEFAALVAAGSLRPEDGLRLVALRGRLMDEAAAGAGAMLALIGESASEMAGEIGLESGTFVANHNAPTQVVLAGTEDAVSDASRVARARGLRTIQLPIRGAFHSPQMASARAPFEEALAAVEFREPSVPVISGVTAEPFDDIRRRLAEALTQPVRWCEVLETLSGLGARRFVEVGPGRVLTGLVRRTLSDVEATTLDAVSSGV
jgi:[acyl-carrier-protein] S-malonyltransferase